MHANIFFATQSLQQQWISWIASEQYIDICNTRKCTAHEVFLKYIQHLKLCRFTIHSDIIAKVKFSLKAITMAIRRNLDRLPRKLVLNIAKFLFLEDIIYLSMTCKRLRRILPIRLILGDKINECGPKTWESWVPSTYFDTPTLTSSVSMATISMNWKDGRKHWNFF